MRAPQPLRYFVEDKSQSKVPVIVDGARAYVLASVSLPTAAVINTSWREVEPWVPFEATYREVDSLRKLIDTLKLRGQRQDVLITLSADLAAREILRHREIESFVAEFILSGPVRQH